MKRLVKASIFLGAGSLILLFAAFLYLQYWWNSANSLQHEVIVTIPPGTSSQSIIEMLSEAQVAPHTELFRAHLALQHITGIRPSWKAGEYLFAPGLSPAQVSDQLARGEVINHTITIPEGLNSREISAILSEDDRLTGEMPTIKEGSLMPDTWHIHRGDSRTSLVQRMQEAQQTLLNELWKNRNHALPYATAAQAVSMASVIEKETGVGGERAHIAGVFVNRLRKGMMLQSDPTVVYGIEKTDGPMQRPLYRSDWKRDHPWNTYTRHGLPPSPICHPGKAALIAAFNPMKTQDLFFVATGKGGHYFARTLAEHNRNIARYKSELRQKAP